MSVQVSMYRRSCSTARPASGGGSRALGGTRVLRYSSIMRSSRVPSTYGVAPGATRASRIRAGQRLPGRGVAHEGLGGLAAGLAAPKDVHLLVLGPHLLRTLARVGEQARRLRSRTSEMSTVAGGEDLSLLATQDLAVVEVEPHAGAEPGVVGEERRRAVVAVGVDRPVRQEEVGALLVEDRLELVVPWGSDLGRSVHQAGEAGGRAQDGAGPFRLLRANGGRLGVRLPLDPGLAPREVEADHAVPEIGETGGVPPAMVSGSSGCAPKTTTFRGAVPSRSAARAGSGSARPDTAVAAPRIMARRVSI